MRRALNDNPTVQLAVLAVLLVLGALLFMTQVVSHKSSGSGPSSSSSTPAAAQSGSSSGSSAPTPGATSAGQAAATSAPTGAQATAPQAQSVSPLVAGPGLPAPVVAAYGRGKTIVLLVVRSGGIDDRSVRQAVGALRGDRGVAVFVTRARGIARYSRITEGVGVSQVPALIVVSPKSAGGGPPQASVSYGFRGAASVAQAVRDAVYKGRVGGYSPR